MTKKVAISQSNFIPWKGYFDLINSVDIFVILDEVQYTRRDWRNRNKIKTLSGSQWITVPVRVKGKMFQKISETEISESKWGERVWRSIHGSYVKTTYFSKFEESFKRIFLDEKINLLSELNYQLIEEVCRILDIKTKILLSKDFKLSDGKNERILSICKQVGADEYVSAPAAMSYIDENVFSKENIRVRWFDYDGYDEYDQLFPPFDHYVTILDLIFNEGLGAKQYFVRSEKKDE